MDVSDSDTKAIFCVMKTAAKINSMLNKRILNFPLHNNPYLSSSPPKTEE